jgi:hypothetical protein
VKLLQNQKQRELQQAKVRRRAKEVLKHEEEVEEMETSWIQMILLMILWLMMMLRLRKLARREGTEKRRI